MMAAAANITMPSHASSMRRSHRISGRRRMIVITVAFAGALLASIHTFRPTAVSFDHSSNDDLDRRRRQLQNLAMYIDPKSVDIKQFSAEQNNPNTVTADISYNVPSSDTNNNIPITTYADMVHNEVALPQYTLEQLIEAADTMRSKYSILHYDPKKDKFTGYYYKNQRWTTGCYKLMHSLSALTILLRAIFPDRFTPNSPELFMGVSSGDYPAMKDQDCMYRDQDVPCDESVSAKAPVLHFGSVFRKAMFPNMIAMPMPGEHLDCFVGWSTTKEVCAQFKPKQTIGGVGLFFGEGDTFEELIPQIIWRGTDFPYLDLQNSLDQPTFEDYIEGNIQPGTANPLAAAIAILREKYSQLVPRWQGVVLTAEAEEEAARMNSLPKVNIKFSSVKGKGKPAAVGNPKYSKWEEIGLPLAGKGMPPEEMAKYKYHIDIGGGGGTTWTGTTDKLAMPGLLFHHITPTKDYIHDHLIPWLHYVPVREDLSDLREKLEWAETNPFDAKKIAESATQFMRQMGTPEVYDRLFVEDVVKPLRGVIEAYAHGSEGDSKKVLNKSFAPFIECENPLGEQKSFGQFFNWHHSMNNVCKKWEPQLQS